MRVFRQIVATTTNLVAIGVADRPSLPLAERLDNALPRPSRECSEARSIGSSWPRARTATAAPALTSAAAVFDCVLFESIGQFSHTIYKGERIALVLLDQKGFGHAK